VIANLGTATVRDHGFVLSLTEIWIVLIDERDRERQIDE
jgi:hypothetical protein